MNLKLKAIAPTQPRNHAIWHSTLYSRGTLEEVDELRRKLAVILSQLTKMNLTLLWKLLV